MPKHKFDVKIINNHTIIFNGQLLKNCRTPGCRVIFKTKEYVIKLDNYVDDYSSNEQCEDEYKFWRYVRKTKLAKYFVPIVQKGKNNKIHYVVQPRIKFQRGKLSSESYKTIEDIESKTGLWDIGHNYTVNNGKVLIYDYAL